MKHTIETIHFYHTNDIHSHFESWPQINRLLRDGNTDIKREKPVSFSISGITSIVPIHLRRGRGKRQYELLNKAGYDAVTIGNNEGITMSKVSVVRAL